ncbi:hypothetical protein BAUCODRAFT_103051 [Baudoinia panamericana UAMH 10762]|uniref:CENP-V/GFA domain-containing protein n=1 Tax=Baudoinia panamericana (strain UAMH 10762) TaxID=717646 RepID=M2NHX1_BAUPA|nr:uncharacterized protein BAUCODRAFT_103051 [Baudoinia panamericana UAMH 10762]EMC98670.1 hypothetical protein BAUCODRAFT_103051 [Baudoinia panamericana UAMH 10762]
MDDSLHHLFGTCACERNQYTVIIPSTTPSQAQAQEQAPPVHVFFDNSLANRRTQASPLTAWLRVPLEWYHSATYAHFPDETPASIKRIYYSPAVRRGEGETRRQFCGYCGTHLTAWREGRSRGLSGGGDGGEGGSEFVDVTLGSLLGESLERLQALRLFDEDLESEGEKPVAGGQIDHDTHIATNERRPGGADGPAAIRQSALPGSLHRMQGRGMPYFEEMVENSRLGRIKRQKGGHVSEDGRSRVEWEVVEIGGEDDDDVSGRGASSAVDVGGSGSKRMRMDIS